MFGIEYPLGTEIHYLFWLNSSLSDACWSWRVPQELKRWQQLMFESANLWLNVSRWYFSKTVIPIVLICVCNTEVFLWHQNSGRQLEDWGFFQWEVVTDSLHQQPLAAWNVEEHRYTTGKLMAMFRFGLAHLQSNSYTSRWLAFNWNHVRHKYCMQRFLQSIGLEMYNTVALK